jgi:ferredoxin-NADP reductase
MDRISPQIDRMMLAEVAWPPGERPLVFVCGPTTLVEAVASALVELGHDPALVKFERFGPTGETAYHASPDAPAPSGT